MKVGERLERLREAGERLAERPPEQVLLALGRVLDGWSAPRSAWREALARALPKATGFSEVMVREGLDRGLAPLTGAALRDVVARELGDGFAGGAPLAASGFPTTGVILAGALPTPVFPAVLAPLVLRSPVLVKTSVHDPVTPAALARSLAESDPELGRCVEVVDFRSPDDAALAAFLEADCIVVTGSDETVGAVARRARPSCRLVVHGHRVSVAALGPEATRGEALAAASEGIARDVALWDQLGCLSPLAVYAVDADPEAADRVAEGLAAALDGAERRWPRGRVEDASAALTAHERAEAEMRAATGRQVVLHAGDAWTVVREDDAGWRPTPLHRFVRVHPARDSDGMARALAPLGPQLAGVAVAGFGGEASDVAHALARLGAARVCAPGALQTPPLGWPADNQGWLTPLARLSSRELDMDPPGE